MRFVGSRSFKREEQVEAYRRAIGALLRLREVCDLDMLGRAYSDAVWEEMREIFASRYRVRAGRAHACVNRLLGKRCSSAGLCLEIPRGDHMEIWNQDGKPVILTSHPYPLTMESMEETVRFCRAMGLDFEIDTSSFYFPARTLRMTFARAGWLRDFYEEEWEAGMARREAMKELPVQELSGPAC